MYCSNLSSKVYSAFSNASKAFDKVLHNGLFLKLIKRNVPTGFVKLLKNWYSRLSCMVRWSGKLGTAFPILWGFVRRSSRGNIITIVCHLCRWLDLYSSLRRCGYGVNIGNLFVGCVVYADDIVLLSVSCSGLRKLMDVCELWKL